MEQKDHDSPPPLEWDIPMSPVEAAIMVVAFIVVAAILVPSIW